MKFLRSLAKNGNETVDANNIKNNNKSESVKLSQTHPALARHASVNANVHIRSVLEKYYKQKDTEKHCLSVNAAQVFVRLVLFLFSFAVLIGVAGLLNVVFAFEV
jgi:hypothetical protein